MSPSFPVTVSEVVAVKEQMGKVISRVNAKVPAGDNEGEEERGNVSSGLREAEKHVVPVNNPFPYAELGNCIAARGIGIVREPDKLIVSFKEVVYGSVKPVIDDAAVGFCLCNELLKPILHIFKQGKHFRLPSGDEFIAGHGIPAAVPDGLCVEYLRIASDHFESNAGLPVTHCLNGLVAAVNETPEMGESVFHFREGITGQPISLHAAMVSVEKISNGKVPPVIPEDETGKSRTSFFINSYASYYEGVKPRVRDLALTVLIKESYNLQPRLIRIDERHPEELLLKQRLQVIHYPASGPHYHRAHQLSGNPQSLLGKESFLSVKRNPHVELAVEDVSKQKRVGDGILKDAVRMDGLSCTFTAVHAGIYVATPPDNGEKLHPGYAVSVSLNDLNHLHPAR